ncbi:MAG TPA: IS1595 family transposase [Rhizomicrobium sp.]|nr:IS1595 family transposase [Rhizomicrobium sp.]
MTCDLTNPIFTDEAAATAHLEAGRWPNGAACPLCGSDNVTKMGGKTQAGMFQCNGCRDKFTVRTGTIWERSHIPLHKWVLASHLMASSKKGIPAHQLHRMLGITYKSAWFMAHRIREAMAPATPERIGGPAKIVEVDETELAPSRKTRKPKARANNKKFVALVERGGRVRSKMLTGAEGPIGNGVRRVLALNLHPESAMHTDGAPFYKFAGVSASHEAVNHDKQFMRMTPDRIKVHTNSAEGYFSLFKRGLVGTYQHMSEQHLHRYLAEFDFRMNNRARLGVSDAERASRILKGAGGKRLTYHQPN